MENNKIGIVINTTKANNRTSGFRAIYSFNNEGWASVVRDTGTELKKVANNSANDPIHFVQFIPNGCCYCIMQPIAGRKDYQSAWLFIHKDIILPKGTLSSIIKKVEEILSFDIEDKKEELYSLLNKTYSTTENPSFLASTGDTYAVRYYGEGTNLMYDVNHVLGDYLYQCEYSKYKSVFLINKSKGQSVADATDLSDTKLQKQIVIDLPKDKDGFKPYIDGSVISNAIRITEGTEITVLWKRNGYAPVEKKGRKTEELIIQKSEYKKSFSLSLFCVIDKVTRKKLDVKPEFTTPHDVDKKNPQCYYFKEDDLSKVSCRVKHKTYHPFTGNLDLTKPASNGEYVIELQPEVHIYKCYISTQIPDNKKIEFTIQTQYKLEGSEIPGFKLKADPSKKGTYALEAAPKQTSTQPGVRDPKDNANVDKKKKKKGTPWYAIIALLAIGLAIGAYFLFSGSFPEENTTVNPDSPQVDAEESEWDKAYKYLAENNTYWVKSGMDTYPVLKDVYRWIKDYQFQELTEFIKSHQDSLKNLDPWDRLYEKVSQYKNKKGTFKKVSNDSINIEDYLNTDFSLLEDVPETTPQTTESSSTQTVNTGSTTTTTSSSNTGTSNTKSTKTTTSSTNQDDNN